MKLFITTLFLFSSVFISSCNEPDIIGEIIEDEVVYEDEITNDEETNKEEEVEKPEEKEPEKEEEKTEEEKKEKEEEEEKKEPPEEEEPPVIEPPVPPIGYEDLEQIFVSTYGSDENDGSAESPLRTIGEGINRAIQNRANNLGTRVNVLPGVYRESIINTYSSAPAPLIVVQAIESRESIISGSDVWIDWDCSTSICKKEWPHSWGADPNPWRIEIGELARRREMVIVKGQNLEQHLSLGDLSAGSFYVDDLGGMIYVKPPVGVDLNDSLVEVAVRPILIRMQGMSDFVWKGMGFTHAATPFPNSAVTIVDQNRVLIEDSFIEWNGQNGLSLKGKNLTVRNTVMNNNGSSGFQGFKVADVLFEDTEGSYNNWRGDRVGYRGWNVGHKFGAAHRVTFIRHTAVGNLTRGLWFDVGIEDVLVEDSVFKKNRTNGIFFEVVRGPAVVKNSVFESNVESGLLFSAVNNILVEDNIFYDNSRSAVHISGDFDRWDFDWENDKEKPSLDNSNWVFRNNKVTASGDNLIFGTTHPQSEWEKWQNTSIFEGNTYEHYDRENVFRIPGQTLTFSQWQEITGLDETSIMK